MEHRVGLVRKVSGNIDEASSGLFLFLAGQHDQVNLFRSPPLLSLLMSNVTRCDPASTAIFNQNQSNLLWPPPCLAWVSLFRFILQDILQRGVCVAFKDTISQP